MKLKFSVSPSVTKIMEAEIKAAETAVTAGVREAGSDLKDGWRGQIRRGGLGSRLANTVRLRVFPSVGASIDAAAIVESRAPVIVDAFDRGVTIRSTSGTFLAIPTDAAGKKGVGKKRITPLGWEQRTGLRLRFVYRRRGVSLLVADDARIAKSGRAVAKKGKRRKDGVLTGATTVPIFMLVPQARLRKRLDLDRDTNRAAARLPDLIVKHWRDAPL